MDPENSSNLELHFHEDGTCCPLFLTVGLQTAKLVDVMGVPFDYSLKIYKPWVET